MLRNRNCCCDEDTLNCFPCPIPRRDLVMSRASISFTLTWRPGSQDWVYLPSGVHLYCLAGTMFLDEDFTGGGSTTCLTVATTCSPFHAEFNCFFDGTWFVDE